MTKSIRCLAVLVGVVTLCLLGCNKKKDQPSSDAPPEAKSSGGCAADAYKNAQPAFCLNMPKDWSVNPGFKDDVLEQKGGGKQVFTHTPNTNMSTVIVAWRPVDQYGEEEFLFDDEVKQAGATATPLPGGAGKTARFKNKYDEERALVLRKTATHAISCTAKSLPKSPAPELLKACESFTPL